MTDVQYNIQHLEIVAYFYFVEIKKTKTKIFYMLFDIVLRLTELLKMKYNRL